MADDFEDFLGAALGPAHREPDRAFVARVQARLLLDERLRAERGMLLKRLAFELVALAAIAAGLLFIARSPAVATFAGESPAVVLSSLMLGFSFVVILFISDGGRGRARRQHV